MGPPASVIIKEDISSINKSSRIIPKVLKCKCSQFLVKTSTELYDTACHASAVFFCVDWFPCNGDYSPLELPGSASRLFHRSDHGRQCQTVMCNV